MVLVKRGERVEEWMWAKGSMWCKEGREEDGETSFTFIMGWWVVSGPVLKMKSRSGAALDLELLMSDTFLKPMRLASAALDLKVNMPWLAMSLAKRGLRVEGLMCAKGSMGGKEGREEEGETSSTLILGWWALSGPVLKTKLRSGVALDSELLMSSCFSGLGPGLEIPRLFGRSASSIYALISLPSCTNCSPREDVYFSGQNVLYQVSRRI
jgi:hypothetical protein